MKENGILVFFKSLKLKVVHFITNGHFSWITNPSPVQFSFMLVKNVIEVLFLKINVLIIDCNVKSTAIIRKNSYIIFMNVKQNFEYFYQCQQSRIRRPVPFIAVKFIWIVCNPCSREVSVVVNSNLKQNSKYACFSLLLCYFHGIKFGVKYKDLLRNFCAIMWSKDVQN